MQVQENDGKYREPQDCEPNILNDLLKEAKVKRILVFPAYSENGKPTKELRRAWRRYRRTER